MFVIREHLFGIGLVGEEALQFEAGGVLSKLLLVSVVPDLALIFVFYTTDTWRLSKGILAGAMPYILAALMVSL